MTSCIAFDRIEKVLSPRRAQFDILFSGIYEFHLNRDVAPGIARTLLPILGPCLHSCWPGKYPPQDGSALDYLGVTRYPRSEQLELLRASTALRDDFEFDRVGAGLIWNRDLRLEFVSLLSQMISLIKGELGVG